MRARLRRFLLMLLMLTLPVQALAYAAMQGCVLPCPGAVEPGVRGQMAMSGEVMAGCHEAGDPAGAPSQHFPAQHDCKFCAACALASAMPIDFVVSTLAVPVPHRFALPPAAAFSGFIPDGPERPPRASLA